MSNTNKPPEQKRLPDPTPDELKAIEQAKAENAELVAKGMFFNINDGIDKSLKNLTKTADYDIGSFYKPELVAKALNKLELPDKVATATKDGKTLNVNQKAIKQKLASNIDKLQAFYDKHRQSYLNESTRYFTLRVKGKSYLKQIDELSEYFTETSIPIKGKDGGKLNLKGYSVNNKNALNNAIKELKLPTYTIYEITPEPNSTTDIATFTASLKQVVELADESGIKAEGGVVMQVGDMPVHQSHLQLQRIINNTLAELKNLAKAKPVELDEGIQLELFSNMKMGVDTDEIIARHQFFNPMYRGLMQMGEQGIYEAVTKAKQTNKYEIAIPYETTGYNSVYRASMQLGVNISGVDKAIVATEADATRLQARLHKAHNMLSLWAMQTNSNALYNVKMTDLLRLAGYEGRIKPDDYIDVTSGIVALVAQTVTRGSDTHYTDPKTGKAIRLGKNELYGEMIRPVGSLGAIWHKDKTGKPIYIKKIVYARLAEGMLNPTQKRATVISKALLQLNTLQERHYLLIGVMIGETYSQHDKKTAEGKPITLTVHTLLEYRGLADPDSLRRADQTKGKLKDALDKLQSIGHIDKWKLKGGKKYADISLDPNGLKTVVEIYPPEHIQRVLRPAIADPDSKLTNLLKQDVREYGFAKVAKTCNTTPEIIESIINNQDTVDSLPSLAYNDLKARQYDNNQTKAKARKTK
jgi:hypothetical protein